MNAVRSTKNVNQFHLHHKYVHCVLISARLFPSHASKHLKWKLSPITPVVVRKTILNSGFRLVRSESPENTDCPDPSSRESLSPELSVYLCTPSFH